jgi:hypothetical protein
MHLQHSLCSVCNRVQALEHTATERGQGHSTGWVVLPASCLQHVAYFGVLGITVGCPALLVTACQLLFLALFSRRATFHWDWHQRQISCHCSITQHADTVSTAARALTTACAVQGCSHLQPHMAAILWFLCCMRRSFLLQCNGFNAIEVSASCAFFRGLRLGSAVGEGRYSCMLHVADGSWLLDAPC